MLVCPICGEDLDDETAACSFCRHELPAWVTRPAVQFTPAAPARDISGRLLIVFAWAGLLVSSVTIVGCLFGRSRP